MKTKFTKGEWKVDTSIDYNVSVVSPWSKDVRTDNFSTFADYRGALICEMHYNSGVPTKGTAIANAKLVAAAPKMFKMLDKILNIENHAFTLKGFDVKKLKSEISTLLKEVTE